MPEEKPPPGEIALMALTIVVVALTLAKYSGLIVWPFNETLGRLSGTMLVNATRVYGDSIYTLVNAARILIELLASPLTLVLLAAIWLILEARTTRW